MSSRSYSLNAPLSYPELIRLIPEGVDGMARLQLSGLMQSMTKFLEDTRTVSKYPADMYGTKGKPMPIGYRIRGIQEQMSAVRFRLDIHDYSGVLEQRILKDRLYELYHQAKEIDPEGTARFERMVDKKMRKARARA